MPLDLTAYFNNRGTSLSGEGDGEGFKDGNTFPAEYLPRGRWVDEDEYVSAEEQILRGYGPHRMQFEFTQDCGKNEFDNIVTDHQVCASRILKCGCMGSG